MRNRERLETRRSMSDVGFYFENTRAGEGDNRAEKGAGQTTELRLSNAREYGVAPSLRRKRLSPPLSMRAMVPEPAVSRWAVPRDFRDRLQGGGHRPTPRRPPGRDFVARGGYGVLGPRTRRDSGALIAIAPLNRRGQPPIPAVAPPKCRLQTRVRCGAPPCRCGHCGADGPSVRPPGRGGPPPGRR